MTFLFGVSYSSLPTCLLPGAIPAGKCFSTLNFSLSGITDPSTNYCLLTSDLKKPPSFSTVKRYSPFAGSKGQVRQTEVMLVLSGGRGVGESSFLGSYQTF